MINQVILKFQQIPKLLLGFIIISVALVLMIYNDPPKTLCDIQMGEINKRLARGFLRDWDRGKFESRITQAMNICLEANSPGGCRDIFDRFDYLEAQVRTLPTECGAHPSSDQIRGFMHEGVRLLSRIAWGEKRPINRYNTTAWLDTSDIGIYCRIKLQYQRLYGREAWKAYALNFARTLPEAKEMRAKDLWDLSLFSYNCSSFY